MSYEQLADAVTGLVAGNTSLKEAAAESIAAANASVEETKALRASTILSGQKMIASANTARDAVLLNKNIKDTVAAGLATTTNGEYFSVPSADTNEYLILYKNTAGSPVEIKRYPSAAISTLTINVGKPYPLKSMVRDGITSAAPASIQNAFLDIKVIGARPGMVYRAEWIGTGTTAFGGVPSYELLVGEYVKANYATNSATGATTVIALGDIAATSVEAGDIITRTFKSTKIEGVMVILTYRPSALPADTSVQMNSPNTLAGWSWIIDENCYLYRNRSTDTELLASAKAAADTSAAASATAAVAAINTLTVNAGKHYPLKQMTRNATTSAPPLLFVNGILDIKITGVGTGKYARLTYFGNGTTALGGGPNYSMIIDLFDSATYATAATSIPITTSTDTNFVEVTANGVTTRTYTKTRVDGVGVSITYLPAVFLPTVGTPVFTEAPGSAGYSWIIDPAAYIPVTPLAENSVTINASKSFPLKLAQRGGITSAESTLFRNGILDIKAAGVPAGYFLRFSWFGNGTTALGGGANYAMEFEIADAATYAATGTATKVLAYTDKNYEERVVSGTIVTRTYRTTSREGLVISITYDTAVFLPTTGSSVAANSVNNAGYSWIVDPACYIPVAASNSSVPPSGPLVYSHTDTETLIAWRFNDTQDIRVAIGRYGVNLVNDIGMISFKPHNGGTLTLSGTWTMQTSRGTDWIGPYIVNADQNGSGSVTQFTGGNHGYTGAGGAATAEQVYRKVFADGRPLVTGDAGYADQITFQWENLVQGSNTRDTPRNILREQHSFIVTPGSIETTGRTTALEALTIRRYYGLQAYLAGYNTSIHFLNGQQSARVDWADGLSSGPISGNSNVWAATARGANGFNLLMWIDRNYGIAKLPNLVNTSDMFFTASTKMYNRFIDEGIPKVMAAGESFNWRGGYGFTPDLGVGLDFGTIYSDASKPVILAVHATSGNGRVALPTPDHAGKLTGSVDMSERVEPDGVATSRTGYGVNIARL